MISVDTTLNFAWALLCVGALVCNWWRERERVRPRSRRVRLLRELSVFLAAVLLFPCISASDDCVRLQDLNSAPSQQAAFLGGNSANLLLAVQLEETEHTRPVAPFVLVLVLCCLLIMPVEESGIRRSFYWDTLGRGPPAF